MCGSRQYRCAVRDIYAIGIKTILADTPPAFAKDVSFSILVELEPGLTGGKLERGVREQVLELITEVLSRYGCQDTARNSTMMEELLDGLAHKALRKRVTAALAALAPSLTDPQLHQVITALLGKINSPKPGDDIPTLVQCLGRLARSVGRRLGPHAPNIMPVFFRQLGEADHEELLDDLAIDVKENSLQAIESFVRQCPGAVTPWIEQALMVANGYLKYDPNFDYEAEEEEEDEDMEGEESEEEEEEYSDMSDDDDNTWKIRRAAVRVISAIASCRHDILPFIFKNYGGALVDRFKEREESVRVDILATFTQLLDNAIETHESHVEAVPSADVDVDMTGQSAWAGAGFGPGGGMEPGLPGGTTASLLGAHPGARAAVRQGLITPPPAVRAPGFINELRDMIKVIAESILRVFEKSKTGDSRTRMAAWQLLQKLVLVMGDDFADVNSLFIPQLRSALKDKTSQLRFEALNFIRMVLDRCSPLHTQPHLPVLVPLVTASVHDEWYKIVAEALRTIGRCAICIRPATEDERDLTAGVDPSPYLSALFEATFSKLSATDIDQEIKEAAISAMSLILGHLGDHLNKNQLDAVLPLFLERLQNEVTRLATLRGLAFVVLSPLSLDFSSILQPTVQELGSLLRQKSRILKQAVLKLLVALVTWQSQKLPVALMEPVMHEGAALISDDDLQLAAHMIELCVTVSIHHADAAKLLGKDILTAALQLAGSPLVQGEALEFLRSLFKKIAVLSGCVMSYDDLMEGLFAFATEHADSKAIQRHTLLSLSNCTAALCGAADATKQKATVLRLVDLLNGESVNLRIMVLHTLAALGKQLNILSIKPSALTDAMALFDSAAHEEVKIAAASAVGGIAVGAPDGSIPVLLEKIQSSSHTYLLLAALKDAFYAQARKEADFGPHVPALLDSLLAHTADKDVSLCAVLCAMQRCYLHRVVLVVDPQEGVRAITSECLGLLAIANPDTLADVLSKLVTSDQPLQRCAAATAMQYPISILQRLGTARLEPFVDATCDQDLLVRQVRIDGLPWLRKLPCPHSRSLVCPGCFPNHHHLGTQVPHRAGAILHQA